MKIHATLIRTTRAARPMRWLRRCLLLLALLMINPALQAQLRELKTLPRPTLDGTWRIVAIDQRKLKRPITNFRVEHFDTRYLPVGTTFTLRFDGPWGTREPGWMAVMFRVHAPIPAEVCPAKLLDNPIANAARWPLCGRKGIPVTEEYQAEYRAFNGGYIELLRLDTYVKPDDPRNLYLLELGYHLNDLYFAYGGKDSMSGTDFIPYGSDVLLIPMTYMEDLSLDVNDPRQNYGHVLLVAKRVGR